MLDSMGGNAAITPALKVSPPENAEGFTFQHRPGRPVSRGSGRSDILWKGLTQHMADPREVMNIRQASQYLGVSPDTLYKYVYEEKIPAFKLGNRWKFKKTILDSWMEKKSVASEGRVRRKPKARAGD